MGMTGPANGVLADDEDLLTLQEAADLLRVHYMTAYRRVRRGDLPAFKAGGRLRLRRSDVERSLGEGAVDAGMPRGSPGRTDWPRHLERLYGLLIDGRSSECLRLVRRVVADGAAATDAYVHLVAPALHRVGDAWEAGELTVSEEHRASEISAVIVARMGEHFRRRGRSRGVAVTLTPPEELHGIASAMTAQLLRGAGWEVHHLGTNVPPEDLQLFLGAVPTDAVCVSVTRAQPAAVYVSVVAAASGTSAEPTVVFGGQGVDAVAASAAGGVVSGGLAELPDVIEAS